MKDAQVKLLMTPDAEPQDDQVGLVIILMTSDGKGTKAVVTLTDEQTAELQALLSE